MHIFERYKFVYKKINSSGVGVLSIIFLYDKDCEKVNYCWSIKVNIDINKQKKLSTDHYF